MMDHNLDGYDAKRKNWLDRYETIVYLAMKIPAIVVTKGSGESIGLSIFFSFLLFDIREKRIHLEMISELVVGVRLCHFRYTPEDRICLIIDPRACVGTLLQRKRDHYFVFPVFQKSIDRSIDGTCFCA